MHKRESDSRAKVITTELHPLPATAPQQLPPAQDQCPPTVCPGLGPALPHCSICHTCLTGRNPFFSEETSFPTPGNDMNWYRIIDASSCLLQNLTLSWLEPVRNHRLLTVFDFFTAYHIHIKPRKGYYICSIQYIILCIY